MLGQHKIWASLVIIALMAPMTMGCSRKLKGDPRKFPLSECNSVLARAFDVSEEEIQASALSSQINNIRAYAEVDGQGPFLTVAFHDRQGDLEAYWDNGPSPGLSEETSAASYDISYRCLDDDCYRIGFLFYSRTTNPNNYSPLSDAGYAVVVQQADNDSATYSPICYSSN